MRRVVMLFTLVVGALSLNAQPAEYVEDKIIFNHDDVLSVVMLYNGTSVMDVRRASFDATSTYVRGEFKGRKVVDYYLNPTIGSKVKSLGDVLDNLYYDGSTHIIFQPVALSYSAAIDKVKGDAKSSASQFKDVRFAKPLIYDASDAKKVAQALKGELTTQSDALLLVVDDNYEPLSDEDRALMESALQGESLNNWYIVRTGEVDTVVEKLSKSGAKSLSLAPFAFVSSVKSAGDITSAMGKALEAKGYSVELINKGLGEYDSIRQIVVEHTLFSIDYK